MIILKYGKCNCLIHDASYYKKIIFFQTRNQEKVVDPGIANWTAGYLLAKLSQERRGDKRENLWAKIPVTHWNSLGTVWFVSDWQEKCFCGQSQFFIWSSGLFCLFLGDIVKGLSLKNFIARDRWNIGSWTCIILSRGEVKVWKRVTSKQTKTNRPFYSHLQQTNLVRKPIRAQHSLTCTDQSFATLPVYHFEMPHVRCQ